MLHEAKQKLLIDRYHSPYKHFEQLMEVQTLNSLLTEEVNRFVKTGVKFEPESMIKIMTLFNKIDKIENNYISILEDLAVGTIREMFDVPEEIKFKVKIVKNKKEENLLSPKELSVPLVLEKKLIPYAKKRVLFNTLVHGSAVKQWESIFFLVKESLDVIDPNLCNLYKENALLTNVINFVELTDIKMIKLGLSTNIAPLGCCGIEFIEDDGNGEVILKAQAVNFPVLMHELIKVVIDYLINYSDNSEKYDLTSEETQKVYQYADAYIFEKWMYRLGTVLWDRLSTILDKPVGQMIVDFNKMSDIDCEKTDSLLNRLINKQKFDSLYE